jgi:hypothetical protein
MASQRLPHLLAAAIVAPDDRADSRDLIRRMDLANPLWGAPRIHGQLLKLAIEISQVTLGRHMLRRPEEPCSFWLFTTPIEKLLEQLRAGRRKIAGRAFLFQKVLEFRAKFRVLRISIEPFLSRFEPGPSLNRGGEVDVLPGRLEARLMKARETARRKLA